MRNVFFIALCTVVFFGVILYQGAGCLPFVEVDTYSKLEASKLASFSELPGKSIRKGRAQDYIEEIIGDSVPGRDAVVLANAKMQRTVIELANAPFGFGLIPTFLTSEYVLDRENEYLYPVIGPIPPDMDGINSFARELNEIAKDNPQINVVVSLITQPSMDENNPIRSFTSGKGGINHSWIESACISPLQVENVFLETSQDDDDLRANWFSTDHHWTLQRALKAYDNIGSVLGWKHYEWDDYDKIVVNSRWRGSAARRARCLDYSTELVDLDVDFSGLRYFNFNEAMKGKKKKADVGLRDKLLSGKRSFEDLDELDDLYSKYYGSRECVITNKEADNDKVCLLIADSYGRNIFRYVASNYSKTVVIFPANYKIEYSFKDCVKYWKPDDLVVQWHCIKPIMLKKFSPSFVEAHNIS